MVNETIKKLQLSSERLLVYENERKLGRLLQIVIWDTSDPRRFNVILRRLTIFQKILFSKCHSDYSCDYFPPKCLIEVKCKTSNLEYQNNFKIKI